MTNPTSRKYVLVVRLVDRTLGDNGDILYEEEFAYEEDKASKAYSSVKGFAQQVHNFSRDH